MKLTIYAANCCGDKTNTVYPNKCVIESEAEFTSAVAKITFVPSIKICIAALRISSWLIVP